MGEIAFVFSGQGAQVPGMGAELAACSPAAKAVFDMADRMRPGTSEQCFGGTKEQLALTRNTQPCVFCVDLAAACALAERGVQPRTVAGFSLGELAALAFAGALSHEQAFDLVCKRADAMTLCIEQHGGGMAAVLGLEPAAVERLCEQCGVYPVNYNSPLQVAVAGEVDNLERMAAAVKSAGGKSLTLKVEGPFHSPFMQQASVSLARHLSTLRLKQPPIPVYSNVTALPYAGDLADLVARQVCSPVRWTDTVCNLAAAGIDTFYEVGPGKTLCNLIAKTLPEARCHSVDSRASLEEATTC